MKENRKLSESSRPNRHDDLQALWDSVDAAPDTTALPRGKYIADIIRGERIIGRTNGTEGYKLSFVVASGEHVGRRFWHTIWLTKRSLPYAKRDLAKLGITMKSQLDQSLIPVFRCEVDLDLRVEDGYEGNHVRRFKVIEIIDDEPDAFAPVPKKPVSPKPSPSAKAHAPKSVSPEGSGEHAQSMKRSKKKKRKRVTPVVTPALEPSDLA